MKMNIRVMAGRIMNDNLWFSASNCNAIFRYNLSDSTFHLVSSFEDYDIHMENIHRTCLNYKDWLIFLPQMSNKIDFYNSRTNEIKSLYASNNQIIKSFASAEIYGNKMYLFPMNAKSHPRVVDLDNLQFENNSIFEESISNEQKNTSGDIVFTRSCSAEGLIYAGIYNSNYYIEYNCNSDNLTKHKTDIEDIYFVQRGSNGIWIVGISGNIEYISHSGERVFYDTKCNKLKTKQWAYNGLFEYNGAGIAIPAYEKNIIRLQNGEKEIIPYPDSFKKRMVNDDWVLFFNGSIENNKLYIYPFAYPELLVLEDDKLTTHSMIYTMDDELDDYGKRYLRNLYSVYGKNVLYEQNEYIGLKDFVRLI